jgi:hypothetical protein
MGFIPDLPIGRSQQAEVSYMDRLAAGAKQSLCQRRRKLSIDKNKQSLFRRDDGMVGLTDSKGQNRVDVGAFEIGVIRKDGLSRLTCRQQAENIRYRNAQAANTRPTMHAVGVYRDPRQKV